jgi:hypothetical protein
MNRKKLKEIKRRNDNKKKHNLTRGKTEPKFVIKNLDGGELAKVRNV